MGWASKANPVKPKREEVLPAETREYRDGDLKPGDLVRLGNSKSLWRIGVSGDVDPLMRYMMENW
jgi:hypothetical protein